MIPKPKKPIRNYKKYCLSPIKFCVINKYRKGLRNSTPSLIVYHSSNIYTKLEKYFVYWYIVSLFIGILILHKEKSLLHSGLPFGAYSYEHCFKNF